jgi:hypothetical protein
LGFGVGWVASSLAGLFGAALTGQWWAFYVPVMMSVALAASGFISDVLPIPHDGRQWSAAASSEHTRVVPKPDQTADQIARRLTREMYKSQDAWGGFFSRRVPIGKVPV